MYQLSLFESEKTIEDEIVEQGLRRGSGFENGRMRIFNYANAGSTVADFSVFLKNEYGTGGYGLRDRTPYKVNGETHDIKGIRFRYHDDVGGDHEISVSWNEAAKMILKMVLNGDYLGEG